MINKDIREENKQEKQWKISLSHKEKLLVPQEKLLVTHKCKCYILLKMINKDITEENKQNGRFPYLTKKSCL